jgi:hypothetical protein
MMRFGCAGRGEDQALQRILRNYRANFQIN